MEEMMMESVETPELEISEVQTDETSTEPSGEPQEATPEDPYSPKSATEYSKFLKSLRDADPANAKYARQAKDDFARGIELKKIEPNGVAGVREKYALLDSLQHGDAKGLDALTAMQDRVAEYAGYDEQIAAGNPEVLDSFDDAMKAGIVKMAPAIMDMARQMDPETYQNTLASHMVESLKSSPIVSSFNSLVDVLNEGMPSWLPEDKKGAWQADKMQRIISHAANMGNSFNEMQQKAGKLGAVDPKQANGKASETDRVSAQDKREQDWHWETNINPGMNKHSDQKFQELFAPYGKRLKLDAIAQTALKSEFSKRIVHQAFKNPQYVSQMQRYKAQKNPDASGVVNFAKVEFDKHAKTVMDGLVKERYASFLNGKQQNSPQNTTGKPQNKGPIPPGVQIVSVRPPSAEIDWPRTNADMIHAKKYRMLDGSIRQVRN